MIGTLFRCKAQLLGPDGEVIWEEADYHDNFMADEGEKSTIDVYLREQANPTKFLALLNMASPLETTTMATMTETQTPGSNGYARQQVLGADWAAAVLNSGDYQSTAATKTFGPAATVAWTATHVALVTAATGTAGLMLAINALSATTTVNIGQSLAIAFTMKNQ